MEVLNNVLGFKDLKIIQNTKMFSFSLDSVLLSNYYKPNKKVKFIADFGTNNGIIPLLISRISDCRIWGLEIQKEACNLAKKNMLVNNLEHRVSIIECDLREYVKNKNNFFDVVYSNPPFFKVNDGSKLNKKSEHLIPARHETSLTLDETIYSAKVALKNGGTLVMIHLAERLEEIVVSLKQHNFSLKTLRIVYSKKGEIAKKVLLTAINDGNQGITILEPLYVHNPDGSYTEEVIKMFGETNEKIS